MVLAARTLALAGEELFENPAEVAVAHDAFEKRQASGYETAARLRDQIESGQIGNMKQCHHVSQIRDVTPSARGCEECLKMGDTWVHLRLCRICGHVGCCDSSKNKHATKHFHATQHPIIQSFEPGENWFWCYVDQVMFDFA